MGSQNAPKIFTNLVEGMASVGRRYAHSLPCAVDLHHTPVGVGCRSPPLSPEQTRLVLHMCPLRPVCCQKGWEPPDIKKKKDLSGLLNLPEVHCDTGTSMRTHSHKHTQLITIANFSAITVTSLTPIIIIIIIIIIIFIIIYIIRHDKA